MIVIDASALVKYVLREEDWSIVGRYIRYRRPLYSIDHIVKEVGNAIWKHCYIRRLINPDYALKLFKDLLDIIEVGVIVLEDEVKYMEDGLKISLKHGITIYDSLYVVQAKKYGEILTCDEVQAKIASEMGIKTYFIE